MREGLPHLWDSVTPLKPYHNGRRLFIRLDVLLSLTQEAEVPIRSFLSRLCSEQALSTYLVHTCAWHMHIFLVNYEAM